MARHRARVGNYPLLVLVVSLLSLWISTWIGAWFRAKRRDEAQNSRDDLAFILGGALYPGPALETNIPEEARAALAALGHVVIEQPERDWRSGMVCTIVIRPDGTLMAGADPRRGAHAVGWQRGARALPSSRLTWALVLGIALFLLGSAAAQAVAPLRSLLRQLPPTERARLEKIARNSFASTRVAHEPYAARPEVWEYLLDDPEFATHVARALYVARYRIWHDGADLWVDDGWGIKGQFTIVHAEPGIRLLYAHGQFEQKILPEIRGQAVGTFEQMFRRDEAGRTVVATAANGDVQVDNPVLNALGKVAAPMVPVTADKGAGYLLRTFARATRVIDEDPARVYQLVSERPDVPRVELEEFR